MTSDPAELRKLAVSLRNLAVFFRGTAADFEQNSLAALVRDAAVVIERFADGDEWRPIEEAPKGSPDYAAERPRILGCRPGGPVDIWQYCWDLGAANPRPYWSRYSVHSKTDDRANQPTLFRPLSPSPTITSTP